MGVEELAGNREGRGFEGDHGSAQPGHGKGQIRVENSCMMMGVQVRAVGG